ncbi:long-chain fatty acid--CoA ligase [Williamsia sp. CHRR-6]|uniref:AMP-dependent synthetase/ligase n=1 Tax=Williamsia sp. CHRR-6 TaxID=2835871 RepID=UPI001BD9D159|nr:long-chain fatty acid--CoA ligase [Williamsia sp. CHRR-6]MBT0568262.1 long-chain fatty acid--CoA ligase [Williamsia sp. CHRR-6]
MLEASTPATFTVAENASLVDTPRRYAAESPSMPLFKRRTGAAWTTVTAGEFIDQVDAVARGLIAAGVQVGDRVAILSPTRYEWTLLDYAIWRAGGATVAIYETSAPDQVKYILSDSGATLLVVDSTEHADLHADVAAACEVRETFVMDAGAVDTLIARGESVQAAELDRRRAGQTADDMATLIYTSGTTGNPKGVALTHRNFLSECEGVKETLGDIMYPGRSTLLFLPLAHVFARVIAVGAVESGVTLGHTASITNLLADLDEFRPHYILAVPRVFEKVFNGAKQKAHSAGKGAIFDRAEATAIEYSRAQDSGKPGLLLSIMHKVFDVLVYAKLRGALGGRCEEAISGGAPLGERLGHFFRGVGLPVYEGYGLSETAAAVTVNRPGEQRVGTVGRPVAGASVRIASDGEVLLRGPMVFDGYWNNPTATAEAIVDGWFHTGDVGALDDGYLSITGRKKELIVTAGGKNVAPAQMEDNVRANPLVSQCMVVGDAKPFIAAMITLDPEALPDWLQRNELPAGTPVSDLVDHPALRAEIDKAVEVANSKVSHAEAIKKYVVLASDFTVESGELTPTMKLKRNIILQKQTAAMDHLYADKK